LKTKSSFTIKEKVFAHLEAWRLYTVIWCGLVSLAGSCIAFGYFHSLKIATLVFLIPILGWTAGLYLTDYLDKELDSIQKPHRPIPSGRIKPKEALVIGAIFALTGFLLSFLLGLNNILLAFVVASLVLTYAKFSKSRGVMGNLNRGFLTLATYFFGVFSANQQLQSIPIYIWLLSLVFMVHDTNSNLVGAIRDIEGDKKGGYITIPVKYGIKKSIYISLMLTFIWLSLAIFLPYHFKFLKNEFYLIMIIDILILITLYVYLFRSITNYSREKALIFHEFFVIERVVLASAFIFGMISPRLAFVILLVSLIITGISQYTLRKRYEFRENTL
jgi:4-hydroxybenzoate polyprenyltransferase/geranylgeranylglycerol-phosphate geranylgeranyltransferase